MRTIISFAVPTKTATALKRHAGRRGFKTTTAYLRALIDEDMTGVDPITDAELLALSREAETLYKNGEFMRAASMRELLRQKV